MTKIAFLGLGQMGTPMATRLLAAGHELTVWNRTIERAEPLREAGATVAGMPAEAGRAADVAITMVTDPEALERVVFGPDGLAEALGPGRLRSRCRRSVPTRSAPSPSGCPTVWTSSTLRSRGAFRRRPRES